MTVEVELDIDLWHKWIGLQLKQVVFGLAKWVPQYEQGQPLCKGAISHTLWICIGLSPSANDFNKEREVH